MKYLGCLPVALLAALAAMPETGSAQSVPPAPDSIVAAPATGPAVQPAETAERAKPRRRSRTVITREEIQDSRLSDAYAVVHRLRPAWLRRRGAPGAQGVGVVVYRDMTREGEAPVLRQMAAEHIVEIRYYDPVSARSRWGDGHDHGVIVVVYSGIPSTG